MVCAGQGGIGSGGRPLNRYVRRHMNSPAIAAVRLIEWYQHELSPRKGFSCAYRVALGGESCSSAVKAAFVTSGVLGGVSAIVSQSFKCHAAARMLAAGKPANRDRRPEEDAESCARLGTIPASCCWDTH
jgi:putative component of membrane protein insertase Oxa1/YidC/SpoIIIJ protein YidD